MITDSKRRDARRKRVILYLRMSSDQQDTSIDIQRQRLQDRLAKENVEIVGEYVDEGCKGWDDRRQHELALKAIERGEADAVAVYQQSRFTRKKPLKAMADFARLEEVGAEFFTIDNGWVSLDDIGGLVGVMVKSHQDHQFCHDLSAIVYDGHRDVAEKGLHVTGRPPLGLAVNDDRQYILGPTEERRLVRTIFDLYERLGSLRQLVIELNGRGKRTRDGAKWSRATVERLLKNPKLKGVYVWGAEANPKRENRKFRKRREPILKRTNHPAVIEPKQFDRVQRKLTRNKRQTTPSGARKLFTMTGLARCGYCGAAMHGTSLRNQLKSLRYACRRHGSEGSCPGCDHSNSVRQGDLLDVVITLLEAHFLSPDRLDAYRERALEFLQAEFVDPKELKARAVRLKTQVRRAREEYEDLVEESDDRDEVRSARQRWRNKKQELAEATAMLESGCIDEAEIESQVDAELAEMTADYSEIRRAFDEEDTESLRRLFADLIADEGLRVWAGHDGDAPKGSQYWIEKVEVDLKSRSDLSQSITSPGQVWTLSVTPERLLGSDDVIEILDVSRRTFARWMERGWLSPVERRQTGRPLKFRHAEVMEAARLHG